MCHRCYADSLVNKTADEIRDIYAGYSDPSCSVLNERDRKEDDIIMRSLLMLTNVQAENRNIYWTTTKTNESNGSDDEKCTRWIYDLDYGYQSMTTEVI